MVGEYQGAQKLGIPGIKILGCTSNPLNTSKVPSLLPLSLPSLDSVFSFQIYQSLVKDMNV